MIRDVENVLLWPVGYFDNMTAMLPLVPGITGYYTATVAIGQACMLKINWSDLLLALLTTYLLALASRWRFPDAGGRTDPDGQDNED
ncbi:uncharacterized protein BDW70DRAFT_143114 [Aspergillus foveolatus]|uniref:uncharacterized protein n=1 Tax=Aspergillus foveolatus TaxID=210207 RepID=UPI003CCD33A0